MIESIKLWIDTVNEKEGFRSILKDNCFLFCLKTEQAEMYVKVEHGELTFVDNVKRNTVEKVVEGKKDVFHSILSGERKLREAVHHRALITTLSFRELLLLETLFYLANLSEVQVDKNVHNPVH